MKKIILSKYLAGFMGISMFMFGILKFFNPFKGWYSVQVSASELPFPSYALGMIGEILVGGLLILSVINFNKWSAEIVARIIQLSGLCIFIMMCVALYVHVHPAVPADVLPLKIKPPVIPIVFALMALINVYTISAFSKPKKSLL